MYAALAAATLLAVAVSVLTLRKVGVGLFGLFGLAGPRVHLAGAIVYKVGTVHRAGVIVQVQGPQGMLPGGAMAMAVVVARRCWPRSRA